MRCFPSIIMLASFALSPVFARETAGDPSGTILVEDNDPGAVEANFASKNVPPHPTLTASGGTIMSFATVKTAGDGSQRVTVSPEIPKAGWYQIWMRWTTYLPTVAQHEGKVPVTITSRAGDFSFLINQQSGNDWVLLGTYQFDAGKGPIISFSNRDTQQGANWDAVKLIPVDNKPSTRPPPSTAAQQDNFAKLAANITAWHVAQAFGRGDAENDPDSIQMAMRSEVRARLLWDLMLETPTEKTNSNWTENHNSASFMLTRESKNLLLMATAYVGASNHLGMDLRGNPELLKAVLLGLERFAQRYGEKTKWGVNWWDLEIGAPANVLAALIILGDAVPTELRDQYVATATRMNSDPRKMYNNGGTSTGANLLWLANVAMLRGCLTKDTELLNLVQQITLEPLEFVDREANLVSKKKGGTDGYYEDGSFIQHGGIPYVAAYGYLLLESYAQIAECLQNTPWALSGPLADNAFRIMEICFDPFVVRGETVQNVVGRSLGSKNYEGNRNAANFVVTASKLLPFANPDQAARIRSLIKKWITEEPDGTLLEIAMKTADSSNPVSVAVLRKIAEDPAIVPLPPRTGFELFANMDMAAHRTGNFAFLLGMNSTRSLTFETIWGANAKGWFQSEGMLLTYSPDIERYREGTFNIIDPFRFPGTTVERFERQIGDGSGANPGKPGGGDFVGGVALDGNGLTAMHVKPALGSLEARKAWFFFGDQIVCLGAGIGAASENTVETTVENARLPSETQSLVIDGKTISAGPASEWPAAKWAWLAGSRPGAELGWVFLDGNPPLHALLETRTGKRSDTHTKNTDPTVFTSLFATLWFDHAKGQTNSSYTYVIVPGRSAEQVKAYAEKPAVQIVVNSPSTQAVKDPATGFTGIVGWAAGEVEKIAFDQPVAIMVHNQAGKLSIAVSDPTMKLTSPVTIKVPQSVKSITAPNDRIKVISQSPLSMEFDPAGANGQSHRIEFTK